jgi:hypothetical protein
MDNIIFFIFCQYLFQQNLARIAHNVPAVWNVFFFKKADNLFQSLILPIYTKKIAPSSDFLQKYEKIFKKFYRHDRTIS